MKSMGISNFKAHALRVIDRISKTRERIVITKRGKPIAEIIPFQNSDEKPKSGKLSSVLVFEKDIVSPLDKDIWEATK